MYTFMPKYTTAALLNEYIADMLTNPNLDKNIRFAPGYLELDEDLIIGNRVTLDFGGIKNGGIVTNGHSIDIASTWVRLMNMDILHAGYGSPVHVNYGRFAAENVLTSNSNNNGRTRGAAYAFDSLQNTGAQLPGAYTNDVENCHMNDGAHQSKHFVSAVSWLPISGVTGTFQRNEPITASGGKYAEVIKVGTGWLKVIGRIGLFDGATITGGISGATATVGTVTNTDFNSHTFYDNNVICPYPYIYHRGGGSKAVDGQYQSGSGGAAIGSFVTQREQASGFGINGFIYLEKYALLQDSDNGQYQYVYASPIHSDNNGANSNYPARFITGGGGSSFVGGDGLEEVGGVWRVKAGSNITVDSGGVSATGTLGLPAQVSTEHRSNAGQSIANSTATIVNFEDVVLDSHSAVTTGASWKFTAPRAGKYFIDGSVLFSSGGGWASAETARVDVYKNGSLNRSCGWDGQDNTHTNYVRVPFGCVLDLAENDYIDFRVFQNSGAALTLYANDTWNFVSICELR